jgi:chromate transport protein ChrA
LILIGAVGVIVGLLRGVHLDGPEQISGSGGPTVVAGIVAVLLGTIEVTLREHRSGYRSHTLLLAVLPPIAVYSIAVLVVSAFATFPRWLNIPLLIIVVGLFVFLWKVLRASFTDARRERKFAARR